MKPRFLLDEHMAAAIQRQLRRRSQSIDILYVGETGAPLKGTQDPDLLIWAGTNGYTLITEDRRTMAGHLKQHLGSGRQSAGVFWIRPGTTIGRIVEEVHLIWQVCDAEEFIDQTLWIPI